MNLNKVFLIGNLTRDPELRALPSGSSVAALGLATNRVWKDKEGNKKEDTQFHNIVVFGKQAEIVGQYLRKGSNILVEGRIQTRSWDGPDGQKKYRTEIVAERIQFGPKGSRVGSASQTQGEEPKKEPSGEAIQYPDEDINPDDIPF